MNNDLKIVNIKNEKLEEFIRDWTKNYDSPITIRDVKNLKPLIKMVNNGKFKVCLEPIDERFNNFRDKIRNNIQDNNNLEYLMPLYTHMLDRNWKYKQIFGLCMILGITDIYDIGCGDQCQVGYITQYQGISYTGIDDAINTDFYNELYKDYNSNICFIKSKYPCDITPAKNSIAICVGWISKESQKIAQALTENFDRVYVQIPMNELELWKNIFTDYKSLVIDLYTITNYFTGKELGGYVFVLFTKYIDDIEYMKTINYDVHNDKFHIGSWYLQDYLEKFKKNIKCK